MDLKDTAKAYEKKCSKCGTLKIYKNSKICRKCWLKVNLDKKSKCRECNKILKDNRSKLCRNCFYKSKWNKDNKRCYGKNNFKWKGDSVGYFGLHMYIRRHKPKLNYCEFCKKENVRLVVANISGEYKRDIEDYKWLCFKCHNYYDGNINNLNYIRVKGGT